MSRAVGDQDILDPCGLRMERERKNKKKRNNKADG
jgi:hypothetical protein